MRRCVLTLILAVAVVAAGASPAAAQNGPVAQMAATCSDYSNQADAQRAADTRDADGDGIYCEALPCPCSTGGGGGGGGGGGNDEADRQRQRNADARADARRRAAARQRAAARRRAAAKRRAAKRKEERDRRQINASQWQIVDVVDGDTVKVERRAGPASKSRYTVRLIGIDTPETRKPGVPVECGGREATATMLAATFPSPTDTNADGLLDTEGGEGVSVSLTTDRSQDLYDSFRRLLAFIDVAPGAGVPAANGAGYDIGETIIAFGFSDVYVFDVDFARIGRFTNARTKAQAGGAGVWSLCGGDFHSEQ